MSLNQNPLGKILASIAMTIALLVGGSGITAYAANASLPGDALYGVKTSIEVARASLTGDQTSQARLHLDFAGRRLSEIQELVADGRTSHLDVAANQFQAEIEKAVEAIKELSSSDPAAAAALKSEADTILKSFNDQLNTILTSAPSVAQPAIQNAIDASQLQTGNDNVNSNGNANLNENENSNENLNENENENGNTNLNENTNANQNGQGKEVENDNDNENEDHNSNTNTNTNQNSNSNEDHHGGNTNTNSNSNDD